MADIVLTEYANVFDEIEMIVVWLKFYLSLFLRISLTMNQH